MKVTNCYIERTFNLGNYESLKIGFEAVLSENDKPLEVSADLENLTFQHFQNKAGKGSAVSNVPTTFSPPAQPPPTSTVTLPEHLDKLVTHTPGKVYPLGYIHDGNDWNQLNNVLKEQGYKWVSAGKESHWRKA